MTETAPSIPFAGNPGESDGRIRGGVLADAPLPDFYPALKDELRFPLPWERSGIQDFDAWRRTARAKVEESLLVEPDDTPYAPEFGDHAEADGYTRQTVVLSLTRYGRVSGALLTPHGTGPFPAVLLLHDHRSKFEERLRTHIWPDLGHVFTDRMQDSVYAWLDAVL